MIVFFKNTTHKIIAVQCNEAIQSSDLPKLEWLFPAKKIENATITGNYLGPKTPMVSSWSTNAVEITQNMAIRHLTRIEKYVPVNSMHKAVDVILQVVDIIAKR